ncbi:uncharacterized protein LOC128390143 [Panonychus citri]|uniref:uncharacterized protein LOC128390143 n=1 Tax=Panonychus citri TaxID=50023 RepID=UPI00230707A8|nr:uncharacterized protein LOC128390143 [Panonychus citri]
MKTRMEKTLTMDNLPVLVLEKIFSYLSLPDKLNCLTISKSWMNLTASILDRQSILNITSSSSCSSSSSSTSSSAFSSFSGFPSTSCCLDDYHQPNRTDIVSLRSHCDPSSIVNLTKWCSNLTVIRIDDYDCWSSNLNGKGGWLGILSSLISNINHLKCLHLPHFSDSLAVEKCLQLIVDSHSQSLRHLSINDNISEKTLNLISKRLINLQFLGIYGQVVQCQGYNDWPNQLGTKFKGLHLDLGFDDISNFAILCPLLNQQLTCERLTHLLLTTTTTNLFHQICSKLPNLEKLTIFLSDETFRLPETHVLNHLDSLTLSVCVQETSFGNDVSLINFLAPIKNLQNLSLTNFYVRRHFFENLINVTPKLKRLALNDEFTQRRRPLMGDDLLKLTRLHSLTHLIMEVKEIDIRQNHVIGLLTALKGSLEHLKLSQCKNLMLEEDFIRNVYDLTLPGPGSVAKSLDIIAGYIRDKSLESSQQTNIQYSSFGIRLLLNRK